MQDSQSRCFDFLPDRAEEAWEAVVNGFWVIDIDSHDVDSEFAAIGEEDVPAWAQFGDFSFNFLRK